MDRHARGSAGARRVGIAVAAVLVGACAGDARTQLVRNEGSDTLLGVARAWADAYGRAHPQVEILVGGEGSEKGLEELLDGNVDIANVSRRLGADELAQARRRRGGELRETPLGFDALAIYVHKENPIEALTLEQLAGIYREGGEISRWSQLGVEVPGSDEIVRVGRRDTSGTHTFFRECVLGDGTFRAGALEMSGAKDVVDLVEQTPGAVGYSGLAYVNDHVRVVPIVPRHGGEAIVPSIRSALDDYPIARPLLMYSAAEPGETVERYLAWVVGDEGQRILQRMGYAPLRPAD